MTPIFTKEQVVFIKELLRGQREICVSKLKIETHKADVVVDLDSILHAPEPPLPEGISDEPYCYHTEDEYMPITPKWYNSLSEEKRKGFFPLYLHPPVNGYSLEDMIKAVQFGINVESGGVEIDYKRFKTCHDQFISTLPTKDHPAPVVWPDDENIQKFIRIQQSSVNQDGYTLLVVRNAIESTINYLKQRMEGNGNG